MPLSIAPSATARPAALTRAEALLACACAALLLLAWLAPPLALHPHYHDFADQRTLWGVPHGMDVLTNLAFGAMGAWGLWALRTARGAPGAQRLLAGLFFAGLIATTFASGWYHLAPDGAGLVIDRAGMAVAFAGVMGLTAADRISVRAGWALALALAVLAPWAAWWNDHSGNMAPWAVLQGGALLVLAALATLPARALRFSIAAVIGWYALSKGLEALDAPLYAWTGGAFSGHSAKHLAASLAALPVIAALRRAGTMRA